ncbi:MAG: hypothetical protein GX568_00530 [Candidatus Gastranaerophilales bacterium]|jgi:hypothetical protein|nr:hypothetical protein [Candidatus Gastranaerophilales bacterium]
MDNKMNFQHKELAAGRWAQMSQCEQLANVGSEVSRALNWRNKGKTDMSLRAVDRALELIDLTVATLKTYPRLKEVLRVREALVDYFYGDNIYSSTEEQWRKYFDYFAYASLREKRHG